MIFPTDYILQEKPKSVKTMKYYLRKNNLLKVKVFIVMLPNTYILFKSIKWEVWYIFVTHVFLGGLLST